MTNDAHTMEADVTNDARTTRSGVDVTDNAVSCAMMESARCAFLASLTRLEVIVAWSATIDGRVQLSNALEVATVHGARLGSLHISGVSFSGVMGLVTGPDWHAVVCALDHDRQNRP